MKGEVPKGAEWIRQARLKKQKPEGTVMVVTIPHYRLNHSPVVYAKPDEEYDWSWAHGLDVCVIARAGTPNRIITDIGIHAQFVDVWFPEEESGVEVMVLPNPESLSKRRSRWQYTLFPLKWDTEMNEEFGQYIRGREYETRS